MIHSAIKGFCAARFGGEDAAAKAMRDQAFHDQSRGRPEDEREGRNMASRTDQETALRMFKRNKRAVERTATEIAEAIGWTNGVATAVCQKLVDDGLLVAEFSSRHGLSFYGLTERGARVLGVTIEPRKVCQSAPKPVATFKQPLGHLQEITIRGVTYASQKEAAAALGVSMVAISYAKKHGRLDSVGLGLGREKPLTIDGVSYPSRLAASEALGVSLATITRMLKRADLGSVKYAGKYAGGKAPVPVTVGSVTYPSIAAAAAALGCATSTVRRAMRKGNVENAGKGIGAGMPRRQITVRGVTYDGVRNAAAALGVSRRQVEHAIKRGTLDNLGVKK